LEYRCARPDLLRGQVDVLSVTPICVTVRSLTYLLRSEQI